MTALIYGVDLHGPIDKRHNTMGTYIVVANSNKKAEQLLRDIIKLGKLEYLYKINLSNDTIKQMKERNCMIARCRRYHDSFYLYRARKHTDPRVEVDPIILQIQIERN